MSAKNLTELARKKRAAYENVDYQVSCLRPIYNSLYSKSRQETPEEIAQRAEEQSVILAQLKECLLSAYKSPPMSDDFCDIWLHFDDERKPFFVFRVQSGPLPEGWEMFHKDNAHRDVALYSEAIYKKVIEAIKMDQQEETQRSSEKISVQKQC